jgi:hypothetical protein
MLRPESAGGSAASGEPMRSVSRRAVLRDMAVEASTAGQQQAKLAWPFGVVDRPMNRIFLVVVVAVAVLLGAGALLLGAFPPNPHEQPIEKTLPNDQFKSGSSP